MMGFSGHSADMRFTPSPENHSNSLIRMVLPLRIELRTSPLPRDDTSRKPRISAACKSAIGGTQRESTVVQRTFSGYDFYEMAGAFR
jgi:hypothetical protein